MSNSRIERSMLLRTFIVVAVEASTARLTERALRPGESKELLEVPDGLSESGSQPARLKSLLSPASKPASF